MNSSLARLMVLGFTAAASLAIAQTMPVLSAPVAALHPLVADEWTAENYRLNLQREIMRATGDDMAGIAAAESIATLEAKLRAGLPANTVSVLREGYSIIPHDYSFTLVVSPDFRQPVSVCMEKASRITTSLIFPDGNVLMVEPLAQPTLTADAAKPDEPPYACLPHSAIVANRMLEALPQADEVRR